MEWRKLRFFHVLRVPVVTMRRLFGSDPALRKRRYAMAVMTGLSGNEMYCLHLKGLSPGDLVIGNSVFSMGVFGSLAAAGRNLLGGEVTQITQIIHEGRL